MTENEKANDMSATEPIGTAAPATPGAETLPLPLSEALGFENTGATATTGAVPTAATAYAAAPYAPGRATGPRIRWASVIWGLIFAASGWLTIWTLSSAERRAAFTDWTVSLSATGWIVAGVVVLGGLILLGGLIGGLRRVGARR